GAVVVVSIVVDVIDVVVVRSGSQSPSRVASCWWESLVSPQVTVRSRKIAVVAPGTLAVAVDVSSGGTGLGENVRAWSAPSTSKSITAMSASSVMLFTMSKVMSYSPVSVLQTVLTSRSLLA